MQKNKLIAAAFTLILTATMLMTGVLSANAQVPTRKTTAYLSVNPHLIGKGQPLTVNLWVYPAPATLHFSWLAEAFKNMTITFTRPDGSKDTFMPVDGSGGLGPGESEMIGAIWFLYYPNQVGSWSVQFSMPQQTMGSGSEAVIYAAATSQIVSFNVQSDPVRIGLAPVPLPTGYWEAPVNSDNREWAKVAGDWLQTNYDSGRTCFNPYSTAPNTGHILWKIRVSPGGIIGDPWGSLSYAGGGGAPNIIIMGFTYNNYPGNVFRCRDMRTGELLWEQSGSITLAQNLRAATRDPTRGTPETQGADVTPSLWGLGSTSWTRYDPLTGALLQTITNVPTAAPSNTGIGGTFTSYWSDGDPVVYVIRQSGWNTTIPYRRAQNELIKWDYTNVKGNNWMTGIVWNVSLKQADGSGPGEGNRGSGLYMAGNIGLVGTTGEDMYYAYNLETGAKLWTKKIDYPMMSGYYYVDGKLFDWDSAAMELHAYDIKTGNELWKTQVGEYPWGSQAGILRPGMAYGNLYMYAYDGNVYAIDQTTGKVKFKFYCGETTETVFGSWVAYPGGAIADGKVYTATSEHTPTQPRIRGNKLFCFDAFTGKEIWNISGAIVPRMIAGGYLIGNSENDGIQYCFAKGKTATTVSVKNDVVAKGTIVLFSGTVMDLSPAQPNTPAIADADMTVWMDYLHMQKPCPADIKGVPVTLTATAPDGSIINIGETMSDGYGYFQYVWTPPSTGNYKIQATFIGSESYWSSTAETGVAVFAAPTSASASPTASPAPGTGVDATQTALYIGVASIIIVAIIVAAALMLRSRK